MNFPVCFEIPVTVFIPPSSELDYVTLMSDLLVMLHCTSQQEAEFHEIESGHRKFTH